MLIIFFKNFNFYFIQIDVHFVVIDNYIHASTIKGASQWAKKNLPKASNYVTDLDQVSDQLVIFVTV